MHQRLENAFQDNLKSQCFVVSRLMGSGAIAPRALRQAARKESTGKNAWRTTANKPSPDTCPSFDDRYSPAKHHGEGDGSGRK